MPKKCDRCFGKGTHALIAGPMERPHPVGSWTVCSKCKGKGHA
jgi:DnaJ-class molecular chaperone